MKRGLVAAWLNEGGGGILPPCMLLLATACLPATICYCLHAATVCCSLSACYCLLAVMSRDLDLAPVADG